MASIFDKFPFSSYEGLNLDWVLQNLKQLFGEGEALYQDLREWKEDTTEEVQTWISNTNEALAAWKTQTESDFTIQITSELNSAKQELLATVSAGLLAIEGVAYGTQNGEPVTEESPYYHNNCTWYKEQAAASAMESRAWANGQNASPLYANNNSKYFRERSEAWAVGQINGTDVPDTDPTYENNAKYYSDLVGAAAAQIATNTDDIADLKSAIIPINFLNTTLLSSGADLHQLPVGVYYTNSSELAASILNKPTAVTSAFRVIIYNISAETRRGMMLWTANRHIWFTSEGANGYYDWLELASTSAIDTAITTAITAVEAEITNINTNINAFIAGNKARNNIQDGLKTSTVNLLDPTTLTTGYWLVANIPTVKENYFYSDYIKIGDIPFCYRDQGASISYLVSCYDAEKTYLGAVDYSTNGYERITGTLPTGYYKITPKKGTVYIRVNGRYQSNLMLCPYFYPEKYIAYGKVYYKGALKCAMFGDSITLGTNGDDHNNPVAENLPYWVEKITGMIVDNYGVGSMGWVSTQYYSDIAYDKISSIDLTEYDVITLCYGVNDTGAVLGLYDSTDDTTIMGQINKCVKYIGSQNPKARIIIIAPWNGASSSATFPAWGYGRTVYYAASGDASRTKSRKDLSDTESELCGVYGCGFVSQIDSPLNGFGLGQADSTTPGPYIGADLVHPSIAGYKAIGEWLSAKINSIVAFK